MELATYYDEAYGGTWLERHAKTLKEELGKNGFKSLDAYQLASWMDEKVKRGASYESALVFSHDAVPDTVFADGINSANVLLRRYLDAGGRLIWLGDVPFWYRARKGGGRDETWQYGVPLATLGAMPLIADSSTECQWVDGLTSRMKSRWYSMRPVAVEEALDFQGLRITPLAYADVTLLPSSYNMLIVSRWKRAGKKVSQVSGQIGLPGVVNLGGGLSFTETFPKELGIGKPLKLACAWHVRFNDKYPAQGLYRFLDTPLGEKDEICSIIDDIKTLVAVDKPI